MPVPGKARRFGPPLAALAVCLALGVPTSGGAARAQPGPDPASAPPSAATPAPDAVPTAAPEASPLAGPPFAQTRSPVPSAMSSPMPSAAAPVGPAAAPVVPGPAVPAPADGGAPPAPPPPPTPVATQPPIVVDPQEAGVVPGATQTLHIESALGALTVTVANPAIATGTIDSEARTLTVVGHALGSTTATVTDSRGLTRDVPIRVAELAGSVAPQAEIHLSGNPASAAFVRDEAIAAAVAASTFRAGANIVPSSDAVGDVANLQSDDQTRVDVPIIVSGPQYFTVTGTTHVRVVNDAVPPVPPSSLLVSDFPERLTQNGILFTADLAPQSVERFLYYHFNPAGQPDRRVVLKAQNVDPTPARVQLVMGEAGPGVNELLVGHLSTVRFLVRRAQNEGRIVTIPGGATVTLTQQPLPAKNLVSSIVQINELLGGRIHLTLVAQDATDPVAGPIPNSALLVGDRPHARGIYPIPEFFFDYPYDADGANLEIPIGQIPLPNLVVGQTLAGDYGVLQSVTVRMVNNDRHAFKQVALYANPRGGRATGTFIVDRTLLQAHQMMAFGMYKLKQYTIPPGGFVRTEIVTMPEGGSSYPVKLIVAPDDGSAAPGTSDSPVY